MLKIRIFFIFCILFILSFLFYNAISPGGIKEYCHDFDEESYFISKLSPQERIIKGIKKTENILVGNPVYFSLRTLRVFDQAVFTIKYKNPDDLPLIEAGILADNIIWRYDLRGLENKLLEQLRYVWDVTREEDVMFLQREKKYNSIQEFLDNPPSSEKIAVYNYDLDIEYILSDYNKRGKNEIGSNIPALRGDYQFFTYIKDEKLDIEFEFFDLNQNKDEDSLDIHLYYNDTLIDNLHVDDDGVIGDTGSTTRSRFAEFKLDNLPEGVYRIELRAGDDIITKRLKSNQNKLSFFNKLYIHREGMTDFKIYTDSKKVQVKTIYPGSLQILKSGDNQISIDQTYGQFEMVLPNLSSSTKYHEIDIEKDGIIITGNGVFSFDPNELINPRLKKADIGLDVNSGEIDYIIAKYDYVEREKDIIKASVIFDLKNAYRDVYKHQLGQSGAYNFLISIPDLKIEDKKRFEIEEICLQLKGKTIKEKIVDFFNK